jgi:4-hydroxybenzoate polyprenyltransferase
MAYSYLMECFYQVKKRDQEAPLAQLLGRTDFTLFPVAGYLVNGHPDIVALLYFLFFYPFAQAHLGANDIIDVENDEARGLKTIPLLFGIKGAKSWIHVFSLLHLVGAYLFIGVQGTVARYGIIAGLLVLTGANILVRRGKAPADWMKALPLFHMTMLIYIVSMMADYFI